MPQFRGALWDAITTYEKVNKAYPGREEILEMGRGLLKEVPQTVVPREAGFMTGRLGFGGTIFHGADVPAFQKARQEIIDQWSKTHDVPPTEEQIRQVFQVQLYQELYGKSKK